MNGCSLSTGHFPYLRRDIRTCDAICDRSCAQRSGCSKDCAGILFDLQRVSVNCMDNPLHGLHLNLPPFYIRQVFLKVMFLFSQFIGTLKIVGVVNAVRTVSVRLKLLWVVFRGFFSCFITPLRKSRLNAFIQCHWKRRGNFITPGHFIHMCRRLLKKEAYYNGHHCHSVVCKA